MEKRLQLNRIYFVLLTMVCTIQANVVDHMYRKLEPGRNITGTIVTKISYKSSQECALMCLLDNWCVGCSTSDKRFVIIQGRGTVEQKQTLIAEIGGAIYVGNYTGNFTTVIWNPPSAWNGPPAVLHRSFDTLTGLELMAGSEESNYDAFVQGKVNKALHTDRSVKQWVDLGNVSEVCITRPDTCGPEGAAVAVWVKIHSYSYSVQGILSSRSIYTSGFHIYCSHSWIRGVVALEGSKIFVASFHVINNQWIHLVLTYIGPSYRQGIRLFRDGALEDSAVSGGHCSTCPVGDGRVVVGRRYVKRNNYYAHMEVDELLFFNEALSDDEVRELYNMYQ